MEKNKLVVTNEILDELALNILNTDRSVSDLALEFGTDDMTILGMISLLKQNGVSVYKEKTKNDIIVTSFGDGKIVSRYPHVIVDDSKDLKILVLSDTWYGSVFSQPSIVSDVYKWAYNMGCNMAFHLGDISVGRYPKNDEEGRNSIFAHGFNAQSEIITNSYPLIEDMPTYFITGEHDHRHLKESGMDIGNSINSKRSDMIYLGPNRRDILIKSSKGKGHIKFRLYHQEGPGTYQISYKSDQYVRAMRSEDKADVILEGHSLVSDEFVRRNMIVFQIAGLVGTAPEIAKNKKYKHNTVSASIITIKRDNSYNIDRVIRGELPYYETFEDDYKRAKQLVLRKSEVKYE